VAFRIRGSASVEIDWMTTEELNYTIRPICVVFVTEAGRRERAGRQNDVAVDASARPCRHHGFSI
jgi:hypothetical protein